MIVDVSYGGENGFNQAIELSADALQNVKFTHEKRLIGHYFQEIAKESGKFCFGIEDTLKALEMGAVEVLICCEELDLCRLVLKNHSSGEAKVLHLTAEQEKLGELYLSKNDGEMQSAAELELIDSTPLLDWLAENYKSFGATLQLVSNHSHEGAQFVNGFGGIGGLLRYRVEFEHFDQEVDELADGLADYGLDEY